MFFDPTISPPISSLTCANEAGLTGPHHRLCGLTLSKVDSSVDVSRFTPLRPPEINNYYRLALIRLLYRQFELVQLNIRISPLSPRRGVPEVFPRLAEVFINDVSNATSTNRRLFGAGQSCLMEKDFSALLSKRIVPG